MLRSIWLLALMLVATPSVAAGLLIGPFCVDGAVKHVDTGNPGLSGAGKWTPVHYRKGSSETGHAPMLVIFKNIPAKSPYKEDCKDVIAREAKLGHHPLLAGQIEHLELDGLVFESNTDTNRYQINLGGFRARLDKVLSGALTVAGGTTHLAGSKLRIKNATKILVEATKLTGEFEIEAWDRKIEGAQISMAGAALQRVTLAPADPKNKEVTFRINPGTGETLLWGGRLEAIGRLPFVAATSSVGGLHLSDLNATLSGVEVAADRGALSVSLRKLAGTIGKATEGSVFANIEMRNAGFSLGTLRGSAKQSPAGITATGSELVELHFDAEHGSITGTTGTTMLEGAASGKIAKLTADVLRADLRFKNPSSAIISLLSGSVASDSVRLNLERNSNDLRIGGLVETAALSLGKLLLKSPTKLSLQAAHASLGDPAVTIEFPVDIKVPAHAGTVDFRTADYKVALTGRLDGLKLKGTLRIPIADLETSHLHVEAHNFFLAVGASAFLEPVIAGVKPTLSDVDLSFANPTAMDIGLKSTGRILTVVREMTLGEPVFNIGEGGKKAKASLALQTSAGADLLYDLELGRVLIARGDFVADNVRFHFLEPGGEIDLNGTRITNPDISLRHLEIHFVKTGDLEFGTAALVAFSATGDHVYKPANPANPTEVSFDARVSTPLTVASARALKVRYADALSLEVLQITNFAIGVGDGSITFGKDVSVSRARINISASALNTVETSGGSYVAVDNARFDATGKLDAGLNNDPDFHVALTLSGPADALSGDGNAEVAPFTGGRVSDMQLGFKCEDGHQLAVPTEFDFGLAGFAMLVTARGGEFSGVGLTGPTGISAHTIRTAQCHSETKKIVIVPEQSGWTWGLCFDPLPHRCKWSWSTPEINIKYNFRFAVEFATATLFLPHPVIVFKDKQVKACYAGIAQLLAPVFVGGYSPQIVSNFPGADKVVNDILAATFEAAETVIGTGFLNAVALSNIINLGQVLCYV